MSPPSPSGSFLTTGIPHPWGTQDQALPVGRPLGDTRPPPFLKKAS